MKDFDPLEDCDPFPKQGLVRQFKQFIEGQARKYAAMYDHLTYYNTLFEAIRIAVTAEPLFKPELGYSFATFLGPRLRRLHRFAERMGPERLPDKEDDEPIAEPGLADGLDYSGGGNGSRLTFDKNWRFDRLHYRMAFGAQLSVHLDNVADARAVSDMISRSVPAGQAP